MTRLIRFFLALALASPVCAQTTTTTTAATTPSITPTNWAKTSAPSQQTLNDSSTIAWATTASVPDAYVSLTSIASRTLNVTGLQTGQPYTISLHQGSTGGATTLVLGTGCQWYGATGVGFGPISQLSLTSTAGAVDMVQIIYNGTVCTVIPHSFAGVAQ